MADLVALKAANAKRWANAKTTRPFGAVAGRLVAPQAKSIYQSVSSKTGVPWYFIAVVHQRESSLDWAGSLAQGDPWNRESVHVPAGRGPFNSWEDAAVDALVNCAPFAARNKDWSIGGTLTKLEEYNGLGYASGPVTRDANGNVIARYPPQASPYIWSGTDQYKSGKYTRDGFFDPNAVDQQLGCAGLLMAMQTLDPSIKFGTKTSTTTKATGTIAAGAGAAVAAHQMGFSMTTVLLIGAAAAAGFAGCWFAKDHILAWYTAVRAKL